MTISVRHTYNRSSEAILQISMSVTKTGNAGVYRNYKSELLLYTPDTYNELHIILQDVSIPIHKIQIVFFNLKFSIIYQHL